MSLHRPLVGLMRSMPTKMPEKTVCVNYLKLKMKIESSDRTKEPSRTSPFASHRVPPVKTSLSPPAPHPFDRRCVRTGAYMYCTNFRMDTYSWECDYGSQRQKRPNGFGQRVHPILVPPMYSKVPTLKLY